MADDENEVQETNEQNNWGQVISITVGGGGGTPDIRIAPLSLEFTEPNNLSKALDEFDAQLPASTAWGGIPDIDQMEAIDPFSKLIEADDIYEALDVDSETAKVIVTLWQPAKLLHSMNWDDRAALAFLHTVVSDLENEVIQDLSPGEVVVGYQYQNFAGFSCEVTYEGLFNLMEHPLVRFVEPDRVVEPLLAQGIPLMNAAQVRNTHNGAGLSIAICDTGIDYRHPMLGNGSFPNNKVLGGHDFGMNDNDPAPAGNAHGTACAGIAAGMLGTSGDYIGGVAYNAKLYALKISNDTNHSATDAAIAAAWDWCVTHKNDNPAYPIMIVSTSFGGGRFTSACDNSAPAYAMAANNAVNAGITVFASSGNNGYCDSMAVPACISNVISVGAVYDANFGTNTPCVSGESCANRIPTTGCSTGYYVEDPTAPDRVTAFSNSASFLDLFAPSNRAYTADIIGSGGYATGDYTSTFGGTSAACPYAAGAAACLQSAARTLTGQYLTPAQVRQVLSTTGNNVTDPKVPTITKPRVNLGAAIGSLGGGAPGGTFTIYNDGNATLQVTGIAPETSATWIQWSPNAPFNVSPGASQVVTVTINWSQAPAGETQRRLLVQSNDTDENPYPGGVYITTNRPSETVTQPGAPSGNTSPIVGQSYNYSTTAATSSMEHTVEYSFNWGDGTTSPWSTSTSASHAWQTTGTKTVTVTARCQAHTSITNTSAPTQVNVQPQPAETVTQPGAPSGNTSPIIGQSYNYSTTAATSSMGHTVEYSFNWGDGTTSPWSTSTSASHAWQTTGTKTVTVTARCQTHTSVTSSSAGMQVNVTQGTSGIRVTQPNGGESWRRCDRKRVTWDVGSLACAYVRIELWRNGSFVRTLKASTPNDGRQKCKMRCTEAMGTGYKLRVICASNPANWDESDGGFRVKRARTKATGDSEDLSADDNDS
jgi:subtilisin family serine protease